jgi:hypothetical protein
MCFVGVVVEKTKITKKLQNKSQMSLYTKINPVTRKRMEDEM